MNLHGNCADPGSNPEQSGDGDAASVESLHSLLFKGTSSKFGSPEEEENRCFWVNKFKGNRILVGEGKDFTRSYYPDKEDTFDQSE